MAKSRTIIVPAFEADFSQESKRVFWKQILPQAKIQYTAKNGKAATIDFDEKYLTDLTDAFNNKALDQTPFLLADADNRHTMDPERTRAEVTEMRLAQEGELPGLYGKFEFPSGKAARAVTENPKLGVSARIREGITTSDGRTFPAGIIHVLGTLDPQVTGMAAWQSVELSAYADNILDLSKEDFAKGASMAKNTKRDLSSFTEEEIDAMSEDEIDAFLTEYNISLDDLTEELDGSEDATEDADASKTASKALVGAGASLSNKRNKREIELANASAATANARANTALQRMAAAEWKEARSRYIADGVPPYLLDLAEPILNRPDEMIIDLSNSSDEEDINVSEFARKLLDGAKGFVDLSNELGHQRSDGEDVEDPDKENLELWDKQFGR